MRKADSSGLDVEGINVPPEIPWWIRCCQHDNVCIVTYYGYVCGTINIAWME